MPVKIRLNSNFNHKQNIVPVNTALPAWATLPLPTTSVISTTRKRWSDGMRWPGLCFVVINPRVLPANRVDLGFFV